ERSSDIVIADNWIYYKIAESPYLLYYKNLYKMRLDGSEKTLLDEDDIQCINVLGDWIYYCNMSDGQYLYKIRTDGTGKTKLNENRSFYIHVVDDWIYYLSFNDNTFYRIRTDGSERQVVD
ncbi:MAG: DUF5050 domain-containing protein, partial [Oscillospiraceae bacterium]|nr:DUF5050 domain-containing protein [Oscillospiraceae bacterium]